MPKHVNGAEYKQMASLPSDPMVACTQAVREACTYHEVEAFNHVQENLVFWMANALTAGWSVVRNKVVREQQQKWLANITPY